jgi:hypothetical protein
MAIWYEIATLLQFGAKLRKIFKISPYSTEILYICIYEKEDVIIHVNLNEA